MGDRQTNNVSLYRNIYVYFIYLSELCDLWGTDFIQFIVIVKIFKYLITYLNILITKFCN